MQTGPLRFATDASQLGLPPGRWPANIEVTGLGNGRPFQMTDINEAKATYVQEFGCLTIMIFND